MSRVKRALCWIRRDLRTSDHAALHYACEHAEEVQVVFIFDSNILASLPRDDRRVTFIHQSLQQVDDVLREHDAALWVRHGDPLTLIPELVEEFAADLVVTARDYEPYARSRDVSVKRALGDRFRTVQDTVIHEPGVVLSQSGTPFRVFTPFSRAWKKLTDLRRNAPVLTPDLSKLLQLDPRRVPTWSLTNLGFAEADLWLEPGQNGAMSRLNEFQPKIREYEEARNFPSKPGTSGMSVHLRFGTVSVREMVRRAYEVGDEGEKWLNELIWREFYQDLLWNNPHVVKGTFQPQFDGLVWPGKPEHFEAWCKGQTGYPIVDAAMRCLNATGWMHNRLRMIVASFLTKDLLIDWKLGESYFAEKLLDFELASNNGGWQWAASTGADAQPYFRIFNPALQSERFDSDGKFIREWIPELRALPTKYIHAPATAPLFDLKAAGIELGETYPRPIVDHATQKEQAIALLASAAKREPATKG